MTWRNLEDFAQINKQREFAGARRLTGDRFSRNRLFQTFVKQPITRKMNAISVKWPVSPIGENPKNTEIRPRERSPFSSTALSIAATGRSGLSRWRVGFVRFFLFSSLRCSMLGVRCSLTPASHPAPDCSHRRPTRRSNSPPPSPIHCE
jgi:hypothetical protein